MNSLLGQLLADIRLYDPNKGKLEGIGPLGLEGTPDASTAPGLFNKILSGTVGIMTMIAGIWFIILLLVGAIGIMASGGDKAAMESAKKSITNGLVGLVIVIAAIFLIELAGKILGFDLILNPAEIIMKIGNF